MVVVVVPADGEEGGEDEDGGGFAVVVAAAVAEDEGKHTAGGKGEVREMEDHELAEDTAGVVDGNHTAAVVEGWPVAAAAEQRPLLQQLHSCEPVDPSISSMDYVMIQSHFLGG